MHDKGILFFQRLPHLPCGPWAMDGAIAGAREPGPLHSTLTEILKNRDAQGGQTSLSHHSVGLHVDLLATVTHQQLQ